MKIQDMVVQSLICVRKTKFLLIALFFIYNCCVAQDLEPRVYANLPKGGNIIVGTYGFMKGDVVSEPTLPIADFVISSNNFGVGYMHTFGLANKLARIQVAVPYVTMDGKATVSGEKVTGNRTGFGDMRIRFGINLLGSPALERKEFAKYQQKTIFGTSLVVSVPTGVYYADKRINIGSNRWGFKPEVGISKRFEHVYAEFYSGVWFYTQNNEFLSDKDLKQKPVLSLQGHASYFFKNHMWVGINLNWFSGGKTVIDDLPAGSVINSSRIGATWSVPLSRSQSVKLQFNTGTFKSIGLNYDSISLGYQYVFF
ncbi:outer membrane putative beta-barrel porin/alpha-amylase [Flavobacterium sp. 103]|uniref:transporter n=1 Tax=Flavobacterium sp. 103 TaxID=2135624 RepID=UPI000D5E378F|nr:transporter [Flavobacterium sp. 103]PVX44681.1 outer membrane putative beta-barrel porin/alpha-amylase [Flavobacterium sp. 103]